MSTDDCETSMSDDNRPPEPKTLPPPNGAKDMYSAPTRIGTLPEEVLAAMRAEASDATLAARTSTMEAAALERAKPALAPPPPAPRDALVEIAPASLEPETVHDDETDALARSARTGLLRSVIVIAVFAAVGGLVAAALTFW